MSDFSSTLAILGPFKTFLSSIALSLTTAFLIWLFRSRVKIVWGSTSANYHRFHLSGSDDKSPEIHVWAEKYYVQNAGKKTATNVEMIFSAPPSSYNLWPPRQHDAKLLPDGSASIKIPSLAPRELLIVDSLDLDMRSVRLLSVNCPEATSQQAKFFPQKELSFSVKLLVAYLLMAGLVGTIYLALIVLRTVPQ